LLATEQLINDRELIRKSLELIDNVAVVQLLSNALKQKSVNIEFFNQNGFQKLGGLLKNPEF
jgi:hypothetical protein